MPPLIVNFYDKRFDVNDGNHCYEFDINDGNHRFEAYSRLGIKEYYFIVWITEQYEYNAFISKYSQYL